MTNDIIQRQLASFWDKWWRRLLRRPERLRVIVGLASADLAARLEFDKCEYLDTSSITDSLRRMEADLIIRAPFRSDAMPASVDVAILMENQSTENWWISLRAADYVLGYWRNEASKQGESGGRLTPMIAIVFYTGGRQWQGPRQLTDLMQPLPPELSDCVLRSHVHYVNLPEISSAILSDQGVWGKVLAMVKASNGSAAEFAAAVRAACASLGALGVEELIELIEFVVAVSHYQRPREEQPTLVGIVSQSAESYNRGRECEQVIKSYAEDLLTEGWTKGHAQGRDEGRVAGLQIGEQLGRLDQSRKLLLQVGVARLGPCPATIHRRIDAITDVATIEKLIDGALSATDWHGLFA